MLQEDFERRFALLAEWEQTQILASLQRIAELMDAEDLDASPVLTSGVVGGDVTDVEAEGATLDGAAPSVAEG